MRKKVAIAVVAFLGGALMLPNHEALAHGGGFGGGGFHSGGLIPFAGDCTAFLLALSNRQPRAELGTYRN